MKVKSVPLYVKIKKNKKNSESRFIKDEIVFPRTHPTLLKVHANSNHLITNGTLHEVASFIIHTGFNSSDFTSEDIALVEVLEPFVFGETAQPATLPAQDEATPGGSTATSIGWGFVDVMPRYYFHKIVFLRVLEYLKVII